MRLPRSIELIAASNEAILANYNSGLDLNARVTARNTETAIHYRKTEVVREAFFTALFADLTTRSDDLLWSCLIEFSVFNPEDTE